MTSFLKQRQDQNKSHAYRTIYGIHRNCEDQMQQVFQQLAQAAEGPNVGNMREELFLKAIQTKNDCYARNVCPAAYADALQCVLSPERVTSGACKGFVTLFWFFVLLIIHFDQACLVLCLNVFLRFGKKQLMRKLKG
jgi:hypothetical protein